jgi:glutathione peroxidase
MNSILLFIISCLTVVFLTTSPVSAEKALRDDNENCEFWASVGECKKNPRYMLVYCALSCDLVGKQSLNVPKSFYEITERDIHGNDVSFERFKGKVVYVVNVASQCGYTESNYRQIKDLQKYYEDGLEIVLAPCNSFGNQEPGGPIEIYNFARRKGFSGIILQKDEVNGADTRLTFLYLKSKTGKDNIEW